MIGLRVLLVDDSQDGPTLVREVLDAAKFQSQLTQVVDEDALRDAIAKHPWDIVLSEWSTTGLAGTTALSIVLDSAQHPPFIIVSSSVSEATAVDAMRAGADDFVSKRNLSRLGPAIHRALREREQRRGRERAERELELRDARVRALLENSRDVIGITAPHGILTYVNPAVTTMFGYQPEELVGQPFANNIFERDRKLLWMAIGRLVGRPNAVESIEVRIKHREGGVRWADMSIRNMVDDPAVQGFVGNLRDITDQKRAVEELAASERSLRASEERFRRLSEVGIIGIAVTEIRTGRVIDINPTLLDMIGRTWEEVTAPGFAWTDVIAPEYKQREEQGSQEVELRGFSTPIHKELLRADGHRVHVLCGQARLTETTKVMFTVDMTAQKHAESSVLSMEAQLRQAQKMEAVGRLAGGVAHDFNNILSVILSISEMLLEDESRPDIRADLNELVTAAQRGSALTRQLLLFSRHQVIAPSLVDPGSLLRNIERMLQRIVREDVELRCIVRGPVSAVRIDPGQLEQVIMNLVINARDAMAAGGKLAVEIDDVVLDEAFASTHLDTMPGSYVRIAVSDTGTGMSQETIAHIFEPFFTTKEKGKGTGLGLSTVFGIVKNAGGSIWVYSELGHGTTFHLYLPRAEGTATQPAAAPKSVELRGTETILLVEDDDQVRRVACEILTRAGYKLLVARDARHAIELACQHRGRIDLLLSDIVMPQMSGPEVARRVREIVPDIGVLHVSGYTDEIVVHHGVDDASVAFLQKPLGPDALTRKVREVLDKRARDRRR